MGCGSSKGIVTNDQQLEIKKDDNINIQSNNHKLIRTSTPAPKPVSFEIPVNFSSEEKSKIIGKKKPPKHLHRLEENKGSVWTVEELEEKQQKANERRKEMLEERVNKSRIYQEKILRGCREINNRLNNF